VIIDFRGKSGKKPRFNGLGFLVVGIMVFPFQYIVDLGFERKVFLTNIHQAFLKGQ